MGKGKPFMGMAEQKQKKIILYKERKQDGKKKTQEHIKEC